MHPMTPPTRLPRLGRLWLALVYNDLREIQDDAAAEVLDLRDPRPEPVPALR